MADPPEDADPSGAGNGAFPADHGRDSDDVIGIGSMAHAEEEADAEDEQDAGHEEKPFKIYGQSISQTAGTRLRAEKE